MYDLMCRRRDGTRADPLVCCLGERRDGSKTSSESRSSRAVSSSVPSSSPLIPPSPESRAVGPERRDIPSSGPAKRSARGSAGRSLRGFREEERSARGHSQETRARPSPRTAMTTRDGAESLRHDTADRPSQPIEGRLKEDVGQRHSRTPGSARSRADGMVTRNELSNVAVPFAVHGEVFPSRYFAEVSAAASLIRDHMRSCGVSESTLSGDLLSPGHTLFDGTAMVRGVGRATDSEELSSFLRNSSPSQLFPGYSDYARVPNVQNSGENSSCPGFRSGDPTLIVRLNVDGSRSVNYTTVTVPTPGDGLPRFSYAGSSLPSVGAGWLQSGVSDASAAVQRDPFDALVGQLFGETHPASIQLPCGMMNDAPGSQQQSLQRASGHLAAAASLGAYHSRGVMHHSEQTQQPSACMADGCPTGTAAGRAGDLPGVTNGLAEPPQLPSRVGHSYFGTTAPTVARDVGGMMNASLAPEQLTVQMINACFSDMAPPGREHLSGTLNHPPQSHQLPLQNGCFSGIGADPGQDLSRAVNVLAESPQLRMQVADPCFPDSAPTGVEELGGTINDSLASEQLTLQVVNACFADAAPAAAEHLGEMSDSSDSPQPPPQIVNACFPGAAPVGAEHLNGVLCNSPDSQQVPFQTPDPSFTSGAPNGAQLLGGMETGSLESEQLPLQAASPRSLDKVSADVQQSLGRVANDSSESEQLSFPVIKQFVYAIRAGGRLLNGVISESPDSELPRPHMPTLSVADTPPSVARPLSGMSSKSTEFDRVPLQRGNPSADDTTAAGGMLLSGGVTNDSPESQQLPLQMIHQFFAAAVRAGARLLSEVTSNTSESEQLRVQDIDGSVDAPPAGVQLVTRLVMNDTAPQQMALQEPGITNELRDTRGGLIAADDSGTMMFLLQVQKQLENQSLQDQSGPVSAFHRRRRVKSVFWTWRHSRQLRHECKLCQEEQSKRYVAAAPSVASPNSASVPVDC